MYQDIHTEAHTKEGTKGPKPAPAAVPAAMCNPLAKWRARFPNATKGEQTRTCLIYEGIERSARHCLDGGRPFAFVKIAF